MATGRLAGLVFSSGILFGSAAWGIAAAVGTGAIMLANAWVFITLKYVGAGYLVFLAVKSLRSALSAGDLGAGKAQRGSLSRIFAKGALIHLTNPKAILSWGAVYSIILPPGASMTEVAAMFGFLYSGSILVFIGYAFLFSSPGIAGAYRSARQWFELTFAALFGAAGIKILTVSTE